MVVLHQFAENDSTSPEKGFRVIFSSSFASNMLYHSFYLKRFQKQTPKSQMFFYVFSASFFVVMHLVLIFQKSFFLYWQITAYLSKCKIITALFILYFASSPFLTKPPSPNDPLTAPLMCGRSAIQNQTENNKRDGITSRPSGPQHHHHRRPNSVHIFFFGFHVTRYI